MTDQLEPTTKQYERERIVLEVIKNNPELHHNAILKEIVPNFMAKTTFEKTRDSLLEKEIILVKTQGNMKFYSALPNYEEKLHHRIERNTNNSFHDLKLQIKKLDTAYSHKDVDEKIIVANTLLKDLIGVDSGFTILDSAKNPRKTLYRDEHQIIQELIHRVFEMIRKDKDFEIIFPTIISNMGLTLPQISSDK